MNIASSSPFSERRSCSWKRSLTDRIVQLRVGIAKLLAIDKEFETFGQILIITMAFTQRRHLDRVVANKGWLDKITFAVLASKMASINLPLPIVSSISTFSRLQASRNCSSLCPVMSYPVFSRMASVMVSRRNGALNEMACPSMVSSVVPFTSVENPFEELLW